MQVTGQRLSKRHVVVRAHRHRLFVAQLALTIFIDRRRFAVFNYAFGTSGMYIYFAVPALNKILLAREFRLAMVAFKCVPV